MSDRGYIVTRPYPESGVGSNLASLAGAVWLARELDRTLVVDWRGTIFLNDKSLNYFTQFFDSASELLGVPLVYAPTTDAGPYDEPGEDVLHVPPGEYGRVREAMRNGGPRVLVLTPFHAVGRLDATGGRMDALAFSKAVFERVAPAAGLRVEIDAFAAEHLERAFAIGVNVATGNGAYAKGTEYYKQRVDTAILARERGLLRRIEHARRRWARRLPRDSRGGARIFYVTDSEPMSRVLARLPNAVTHRTIYPPPGSGRYFSDYASLGTTDVAAAADVVADLFLLSRCNALVRNFSMFNEFGTVLTDRYSGNLLELESLYPVRYFVRRLRNRARRELSRLGAS